MLYLNKNLVKHGKSLSDTFQKNEPFKPIVVDDFFEAGIVEKLYDNFPDINSNLWLINENEKYAKDNPFERKLIAISEKDKFPEYFLKIFNYLDSKEFISFIEFTTGLTGLMPDTTGIHTGLRGMIHDSHQMIHSDAVMNPITNLEKKLTMILYLNKSWKKSMGGYLELWDDEKTKCVKSIAPTFNRMVMFQCTETSFHGVPEVIKTDNKTIRKSLMWSYVCVPRKDNSKRMRAKFISTPKNKFTDRMEKLSNARAKIGSKAKFIF